MFGIGSAEFAVFLVIVLVALGPERIPSFMRTLGRTLRQIRSASREFRDAIGIDEFMREDPLRTPPRRPAPPPVPPIPSVTATAKSDSSAPGDAATDNAPPDPAPAVDEPKDQGA